MTSRYVRRGVALAVLVLLSGAVAWMVTNPYAIADYLRLRGYQPAPAVAALAADTTMTDSARHLFYINRPELQAKADFAAACPFADKQTIVIGCYIGGQRGIHVLQVDDERLAGVEEVTAAHEMLHAAYDRLRGAERARIDALLQAYADDGLQDARIKDVLQTYLRTEPGQQLNEMHSIFGTEIAELPAELEAYYARYFTDRRQVAGLAGRYQEAFTSRQAALDRYDAQLKELEQAVNADTRRLEAQEAGLDASRSRLERLEASDDIAAYNAQVAPYNAQVDAYNRLLQQTRQQIERYNALVAERNAIAAQSAELRQAIDSSQLPASQ